MSGFIQLEIKPVKLSNNERKEINKKLNAPVNDRQIRIINDIQKNKNITQAELANKHNVNEKNNKKRSEKIKRPKPDKKSWP